MSALYWYLYPKTNNRICVRKNTIPVMANVIINIRSIFSPWSEAEGKGSTGCHQRHPSTDEDSMEEEGSEEESGEEEQDSEDDEEQTDEGNAFGQEVNQKKHDDIPDSQQRITTGGQNLPVKEEEACDSCGHNPCDCEEHVEESFANSAASSLSTATTKNVAPNNVSGRVV